MVYSAISDSIGTISQFTRYESVTLSHSGVLTAYQKKLIIPYDVTMQTNFNDIRFNIWNGTAWKYVPYWVESKTDSSTADVWIKNDYNSGDTIVRMYYGNDGLSSESSGSDVFMLYDHFEGSSIDSSIWNFVGTWTVTGSTAVNTQSGSPYPQLVSVNPIFNGISDYIIEGRTRAKHDYGYGMRMTSEIPSDGTFNSNGYNIKAVHTYLTTGGPVILVDQVSENNAGYDATVDTWYTSKTIINPSGTHYCYLYSDDWGSLLATALTTIDSSSTDDYFGLWAADGITEQDWIRIRKYTTTEPTYTIGLPQHQRRVPAFIN